MLYILGEDNNFHIYLLKNNDLIKTEATSNNLYNKSKVIKTIHNKIDNYIFFKVKTENCFLYNSRNKIIVNKFNIPSENIIYDSTDNIINVEYYIKNNAVYILSLENNKFNSSLYCIKILCLTSSLDIINEFKFNSEQIPSYLSFVVSDFNDVFIAYYDTTLKFLSFNTLINRWSKLTEISKSLETKVISRINLLDNNLHISVFSNNTINLYTNNYFKNSEWNLTNSFSLEFPITSIYFIKSTKPLVYIIDNLSKTFLIDFQDFMNVSSLDNTVNNLICCHDNDYYLIRNFFYISEKEVFKEAKTTNTIKLIKKEDSQDLQVLDLNKILTTVSKLEQKIDLLNNKIDNLYDRSIFNLFRRKS